MKLETASRIQFEAMSPPARGRGLKQIDEGADQVAVDVAPRTGAWIETLSRDPVKLPEGSPPVRGRGLRFEKGGDKSSLPCRPLRGSVIEMSRRHFIDN